MIDYCVSKQRKGDGGGTFSDILRNLHIFYIGNRVSLKHLKQTTGIMCNFYILEKLVCGLWAGRIIKGWHENRANESKLREGMIVSEYDICLLFHLIISLIMPYILMYYHFKSAY